MDAKLRYELGCLAYEIRLGALEAMGSRGFGHAGGSLSVADALAVLYGAVMHVDAKKPHWPERDKLVCSKGHAGPAVYAALAVKGYFPREQLKTLNQPGTMLPSHCDRNKTPGVDMTTGSLGQGASLAVGLALGDALKRRPSRTYLILGDGEVNEGQVWEAMMLAAARRVSNLTVLVDNNKKQLDGTVKEVLDTGDLAAKFSAFGLAACTVNGNDIGQVYDALQNAASVTGQPQAIVLDTVKGAGVAEIEQMAANHNVVASGEKWAQWHSACEAAYDAFMQQGGAI